MYRYSAAVLASAMLVVACSDSRETEPTPREEAAVEAPATTSPATSVVGQVPLKGQNSAFVVLTARGAVNAAPPDTQAVMDQIQMAFIPSSLIASQGQPVQFRSSDDELHNVNVTRADTRVQEFNVAIVPDGKWEYTFKNAGLYNVTCDVHPTMTAQILVASTPHVVVTGPDGNFALEGVAPGAYTLTIYAGTNRVERELQVAQGRNEVQFGDE